MPSASSPGDVLRETDAARAKNAALVIEHNARAEVNMLGLVDFFLGEAAVRLAVIHRIFLQLAFARLVANRAIERMIDEQKFQHAFAHLLHAGRGGVNFHAGRNRRGAGDGGARRLGDFGRAIGIHHRLAVRPHGGRAELDEAHAAIAHDRQLGMIAIMRHVRLRQRAGLDHRRRDGLAGKRVRHRLRHGDFLAVHLDLDGLDRRRRGLGFSCRGRGHN